MSYKLENEYNGCVMDRLPTRPTQHIIEKQSLNILSKVLPQQWIMRHQSVDDYGIDIEIEFVDNKGNVSGDFFKAQVKGATQISMNTEGRISFSGIKYSTLNYWTRISRHLHVIVFYVDVTNERIFWTPVFWQACTLMDGNPTTKTIYFENELLKTPDSIANLIVETATELHISKIKSCKWFIRNLESVLELVEWCNYADYGSLVDDGMFRQFLDEAQVICEDLTINVSAPSLSYSHWARKSNEEYGDYVANFIAKIPVNFYFENVIIRIKALLEKVQESLHFWVDNDMALYEYATNFTLIEDTKPEYVIEWYWKNERYIRRW